MPEVATLLQTYAATGSDTLVLSAVTGLDGYDERPALDETGWRTLLSNLDRLAALAAEHEVRAVLHPHVGTMVQNPDEVQRVLDGSQIALCLDTGHLLIGGTDPAELTRQAPERIAHTHMKDVDAGMARQVQDGRRTYTEASGRACTARSAAATWTSRPSCGTCASSGYQGWYVLEQDTILTEEPRGEGPLTDVRTSVEYLRGLLTR